jgi:hypothetical protein
MSQQLAFSEAPPTRLHGDLLLEQTRQLFQHHGSNAELMAQIMSAIRVLQQLCEPPEAA